jgi:hypothetical protein
MFTTVAVDLMYMIAELHNLIILEQWLEAVCIED